VTTPTTVPLPKQGVAPYLEVTVHGQPVPQGSTVRTQYGVRHSNATQLRPWREAVKWATLAALPTTTRARPLDGPVAVQVTFSLPKPASAPRRRRTWPIKRRSGDLDKLLRGVLDALTDAGVWVDDAQVVEVIARKTYPGEEQDALHVPGAVIRIWEVTT